MKCLQVKMYRECKDFPDNKNIKITSFIRRIADEEGKDFIIVLWPLCGSKPLVWLGRLICRMCLTPFVH